MDFKDFDITRYFLLKRNNDGTTPKPSEHQVKQKSEAGEETSKEQYLSKLSEQDRKNLVKLSAIFEDLLKKQNRKGALIAIGSSHTKPNGTYGDIDLVVGFESNSYDIPEEEYTKDNNKYYFETSLKDYEMFKAFVTELVLNTDFTIDEDNPNTTPPIPDHEFPDIPSILAHSGAVALKCKEGKSIELMRTQERGKPEKMIMKGKPYSVIAKV